MKVTEDDKLYWLAWHTILAGQSTRFWSIINHFGGPREAWQAPDQKFDFLNYRHRQGLGALMERRKKIDLDLVASYLDTGDMETIFFAGPGYPEQLMNIYDPPPVLFVRGDNDTLALTSVALVGSRRATPYGLTVAERLGNSLAQAGISVTSGLARGIDTAAHHGALKGGGTTVAVLGCGVDVIYPKENGKLLNKIIDQGAVISEFPPGTPPNAWHFPVRNRVISGMSKIIVVVEGAEKSGALITAHVALEQGREVMAVPGNITNSLSRGPNGLIKQGAAPVLDVDDILEELGEGFIFSPQLNNSSDGVKLTTSEQKIDQIIDYEPVSLDTIVQKTGLPVGEVMSALMYLEVKGVIRQFPGKLFAKAK